MSIDPAVLVIARSIAGKMPVFVVGDVEGRPPVERVSWANAEETLRRSAVAGAALIVIGRTEDLMRHELARDRILRRSPAWGLNPVWIGDSAPPEEGLAVRVTTNDVPQTLDQILEMAHEKSLDSTSLTPMIVDCTDEVCVTCSDEGRLGEVISPPEGFFMPARVRTAEGIEDVDVTLIGDVREHDIVLIHAGGAIALIEESQENEVTGAPA